MLERNLFDEAARILAIPIPRRKAFKHLAAGFAGAALFFLWPKRATAAYELDKYCGGNCGGGCVNDNRCAYPRKVDDRCTTAGGKAGHCAKNCQLCHGGGCVACCSCVPGPPPDAPEIGSIPEVTITREASLAAGNCQEGTDWVLSWFPGRDSVSAREAAAAAIARGKPRLARYIARTAHLVQRSAQV